MRRAFALLQALDRCVGLCADTSVGLYTDLRASCVGWPSDLALAVCKFGQCNLSHRWEDGFLDQSEINKGAEELFEQTLDILNIGLAGFAQELSDQQVAVIQLDWRPPGNGDAELADLLSRLGG